MSYTEREDSLDFDDYDDGLDEPTGNGRLDGPLEHNNALMLGGEPSPQAIWRNLRNYGYASPRLEFVQSLKPVSFTSLARKWSVKESTLRLWDREDGWGKQRERFWEDVNSRRNSLLASDIAGMQADEVGSRIGMWKALRDALESIASQGYIEEVTQKGGLVKRNYSPKDLKDMAAVMEKIDDGIGLAIGLTKEVLRKDTESSDVIIKSVSEVTYRVRGDDTQSLPNIPIPELPAPSSQVIEAVIETPEVECAKTIEQK